jgi:hypothetical protein
MMATENYGAICIGNAESQRQCIFGWELQAEELFPDVGHWRLILSYILSLAEVKRIETESYLLVFLKGGKL